MRGREGACALLCAVTACAGAGAAGEAAAGPARAGGGPGPVRASLPVVLYGGAVRLSGRVAGAASGERVVLERRRHGEPGLSAFASVTTTTGGVWSVLLHPRIRTVYAARVGDARTSPVTVEVRPRVGLSVRDEAFLVKVVAARSYEGKYVVLQRLGAGGAWVTLRRAYLGRPPKRFGTDIPAGESRVRAFLPAGQAGPGYVASLSREITFER